MILRLTFFPAADISPEPRHSGLPLTSTKDQPLVLFFREDPYSLQSPFVVYYAIKWSFNSSLMCVCVYGCVYERDHGPGDFALTTALIMHLGCGIIIPEHHRSCQQFLRPFLSAVISIIFTKVLFLWWLWVANPPCLPRTFMSPLVCSPGLPSFAQCIDTLHQ